MSSKRKEYKVDDCAKKVALFFLACDANPVTRVSILAIVRAKGYSNVEASDGTLQMQVCHESQKIKAKNTPCTKSAAPLLLLTLATAVMVARQAHWAITPNQTAALAVVVGGINAGILPSPERKVRKRPSKSKSTTRMRESAGSFTPRPTRPQPLLSPKRRQCQRKSVK